MPADSEESKPMITLTIDEEGDQIFLGGGAEVFLSIGKTITRRASHVLPNSFLPRILFRIIRTCVSDQSRFAEWTRNWRVLWRVDASPVGGEILEGRWANRAAAIEAEVEYLNKFFLEEK